MTEYNCPSCEETIAAVGHWGLNEQPLQWARYRLKDYAIECRMDLWLVTPNGRA